MTPKIRQHASNALEWAKTVWVPLALAVLGTGLFRTNQTATKAETSSRDQSFQMGAMEDRMLGLESDINDLKTGVKPRMVRVEGRVARLERSPRTTIVPQRAAAVGDTVARSPGILSAPRRWGAALWNKITGR